MTMRERRYLDTDRHDELIANRRHDRRYSEPPAEVIESAVEEVRTHDIPGLPPVSAAKLIREHVGLPLEAGDRELVAVRIQEGDPLHGAKRSEDHISSYTIEHEQECPECGYGKARYIFTAHHFIAGGERIECPECGYVHHSDEWG